MSALSSINGSVNPKESGALCSEEIGKYHMTNKLDFRFPNNLTKRLIMSRLYNDFGSTDCPKKCTMSAPLGIHERIVLCSK